MPTLTPEQLLLAMRALPDRELATLLRAIRHGVVKDPTEEFVTAARLEAFDRVLEAL